MKWAETNKKRNRRKQMHKGMSISCLPSLTLMFLYRTHQLLLVTARYHCTCLLKVQTPQSDLYACSRLCLPTESLVAFPYPLVP